MARFIHVLYATQVSLIILRARVWTPWKWTVNIKTSTSRADFLPNLSCKQYNYVLGTTASIPEVSATTYVSHKIRGLRMILAINHILEISKEFNTYILTYIFLTL
jgi:hypothetical protein